MANDILTVDINEQLGVRASFTITLNSLANGSARQSTLIHNTGYMPAALISLAITSNGSAPTLGAVYEVYLIRGTDDGVTPDYITDGGGKVDAAITILNATLIGTIRVTASTNTIFYGDFTTEPAGPLGPLWGIAVKNSSGQALHDTTANVKSIYDYYRPQVQ